MNNSGARISMLNVKQLNFFDFLYLVQDNDSRVILIKKVRAIVSLLGGVGVIRQYDEYDIDALMKIWLDTNIQAHNFIPSDYWRSNYDMVRKILPYAEIYVYQDDSAKQIIGFIGLNGNYIEGVFVKETMQSKGIGKMLLDYVKNFKTTLTLSVYQKNKKAIRFYLREKFSIQSENVDDNTEEKEFIMVWNRQIQFVEPFKRKKPHDHEEK